MSDERMSDERIVKTINDYERKIGKLSLLHVLMVVAACVGVPMGVMVLSAKSSSDDKTPVSIPLFIAGLVVYFFCFWLVGRLKNKLKKGQKQLAGEYVVKGILAERIDILEYKPEGCVDKRFLRNLGVLPGFDYVYSSDYIRGIYKKNEITYFDLKLEKMEERTNRKGNSSYERVTVFRGQVISIMLGRPLGDRRVRIWEKDKKRKGADFMDDAIGAVAGSLGIKAEEQVVSLESEAFNNQFRVKSNDEELTFYILTPQFMEGIVRADTLAEGKTNICFGGDRANISLNNGRDVFEIDRFMDNINQLEENRQEMRDELNEMLSVVDEILKKEQLFNSDR